MSPWALPLAAAVGLAVLFAAAFLVCRRLDNFGFVDVAWAFAFTPLVWFYAVAAPGWLPRRLALATLATIWSVRLGTHLLRRVAHHHPHEDRRYQQLRRDWSANFTAKMAGFFQLQGLSIVLLGVPFLLPMLNVSASWSPWEFAGLALWTVAFAGESLADAQLAAFKRDPANAGRICDTGLWRYSRHPNYFFEWLIWVAYFLCALGSPWGCFAVIAPATILYLLLRVTGIPMIEEQAARSKGDAYRRYQAATSVFVPWPPKKIS